ncbi:Putative membrane protein [Mycobacterium sp. smrl_JER01]
MNDSAPEAGRLPSATMTDSHSAGQNPTAGSTGPNPPAGSCSDIGLLVLRLGIGAAILQAGLMKVVDFSTTVQFMSDAGWRLPALAAFMVTATETLSGVALLLGVLTPLAGCAALGAMLCAWAVNVSGTAFWSEPFNVAFLLGLGAATLVFTGAGKHSVDGRILRRITWSGRVRMSLIVVAFAVAVITWMALYGVNPIHFTAPSGP